MPFKFGKAKLGRYHSRSNSPVRNSCASPSCVRKFGPVTLLYADGPISQVDLPPCGDLVLRSEPHPNNESALRQVVRLWESVTLFMPLILEDDGTVVWSGLELLHECDARKERAGRAK